MDFYRKEEKLKYIHSKSVSYEEILLSIFRTSNSIESVKRKDLFEFEIEELAELMSKLTSNSKDTVRQRYYQILNYINTYRHLRRDRENPLHRVDTKWYEQFVESKRRIISEAELEDIIFKALNPQDKALLRLVFEGVKGINNSELLNLKVEDVDFTSNKLCLTDDIKGNRTIEVTHRCITLIKDAIGQREYYLENKYKLESKYELIDSEYVIKRVKRRSKEHRDKFLILRKMPKFNIKIKDLQYSGMAKKAVEISKKYNLRLNELNHKDHLKEIAVQFNIASADKNYDNYTIIKKHIGENDYEIVRELYGEFEDYSLKNFVLVEENEVEHEEYKRKRRIDSDKYRELTILQYGRCAVTGETFKGILEACHIQPYINKKSNHIQNSILLRVDIHELFDSGYISIDKDYRIKISSQLKSIYYQTFNGKKIYLPKDSFNYPSIEAIEYNATIFKE